MGQQHEINCYFPITSKATQYEFAFLIFLFISDFFFDIEKPICSPHTQRTYTLKTNLSMKYSPAGFYG